MILEPDKLIKQYGEVKTRDYLRWWFADPAHFWDFAAIFSRHLGDIVPAFHREVANEVMQEGKVALAAPRGFAKSTVIGLIYLAWRSLNGFSHFVPYISDTFLQAKLIVGGLRSEIESNRLLNFVYPDARSEKWGEEGFIVNGINARTFILPLGAGMKIRGLKYDNHRPDLVIIDDLENLEAVYSAERRKKLKNWFDYDLEPAMDRYNKNIVYIGTLLHYNSLLKEVVERKGKYTGWRTKKYKALGDNGQSLWPARFSAEYLRAIRDDPTHPDYVGSIVFAQELQNEPQDDQDRIIKMAWIKEYSYAHKWRAIEADDDQKRQTLWLNKLERVAGVDPAISEKETADYFAMYVMGFENDTANEYMLDLFRDRIPDINVQVTTIVDMVKRWRIQVLGIEAVAFQSGLAKLVRNELARQGIYNCSVISIKTDKDKIRRARIHSSAFESGNILLRSDHDMCAKIKGEIEEFPLGAHDDMLDALMLGREARQRPKARAYEGNPLLDEDSDEDDEDEDY